MRESMRRTETGADAIRRLAGQTQRPIEEVEAIYAEQMRTLQAGARVTTYLPVLAFRRTREWLRAH